ncbi:Gfo/Idh/MocA family protein [Candidatus Neomarinimicrobiota bacterium]
MRENNKEIAVGIVGCGTLVSQVYSKVLPQIHGISIKYVSDLNWDLAQQVAKTVGAVAVDFDRLIGDADITVIATPPHTHHQLAKEAISVGKTVICEKPFVTTHDEAQDLVALAEARGANLYVAHMRRLYPSVQLARKVAAENRFGDLKKIFIHEGGRFKYFAQSNYVMKEKTGGVVYDTGSHTLDMALYIGLLCDDEITINMKDINRDRVEPSHHISGKFNIEKGTDNIDCEFCISRVVSLSNKITFMYENGRMDVPTALSDRLRISSAGGSEIAIAERNLSPMQVYYDQFKAIFSKSNDQVFAARRFLNLTNLVEAIATSEVEAVNE